MKAYTQEEHEAYQVKCQFFLPVLKALRFSDVDMCQFYARFSDRYTGDELSRLMLAIGERRSPQVIEEMYEEQKQQVRDWLDNHQWYIDSALAGNSN